MPAALGSTFNRMSAEPESRLQLTELQARAVDAVLRSLKVAEDTGADFARAASAPDGTNCWWTFAAFETLGNPKALLELSPSLSLICKTPEHLNEREHDALDVARARLALLARLYGVVAAPLVLGTRRGRPSPLALGLVQQVRAARASCRSNSSTQTTRTSSHSSATGRDLALVVGAAKL